MNKKAFTLVEVLVVIAIIGILATIIITNVNAAREQAKIAVSKAETRQIYNAILLFQDDTGEWPGHKTPYEIEEGVGGNEICSDGCSYGLTDPQTGLIDTDGNYTNWNGPYIATDLLDEWGNEYFFDTDYDIEPGSGEKWAVAIGSYGSNGEGLNLYDEDDVIYVIAE